MEIISKQTAELLAYINESESSFILLSVLQLFHNLFLSEFQKLFNL